MRLSFDRRFLRGCLLSSVAATASLANVATSSADQPPKQTRTAKAFALVNDLNLEESSADESLEFPNLWLGIGLRDASDDLLEYVGIDNGVVVAEVVADSPASKVDVKEGDILISVDGKELSSSASLMDIIKKIPAKDGDAKQEALKLKLLRKGKEMTVELTPEKRPEQAKQATKRRINIEQVLDLENKSPEAIKELLQEHFHSLGKEGVGVWSFGVPSAMRQGQFSAKIQGDFEANVVKDINGKRIEVKVQRKNDGPAKVTVKEGDKATEYTEKQLDEVPEEVRDVARSLLGGSPGNLRSGALHIELKKGDKQESSDGSNRPTEKIERKGKAFIFGGPNARFIVPENADELRKMAEEMAKNAQQWTRDAAAAVPAEVKELKKEIDSLRKELQELRTQLKSSAENSSSK